MKSHRITEKTSVICDECGGGISIEAAALKTKRFTDGIEVNYFRCSSCGNTYVYLVTDSELRKDIRRRGHIHSTTRMKLRAQELKKANEHRVNELP